MGFTLALLSYVSNRSVTGNFPAPISCDPENFMLKRGVHGKACEVSE